MCDCLAFVCVQLSGDYGFTRKFRVEKFYLNAKIGTIHEETSNMQSHTIAKAVRMGN